jgi:hypothetical protein
MPIQFKTALVLSCALSLSACAFTPASLPPAQVSSTVTAAPSSIFFASALIKRPLFLGYENGTKVPVAYLPSGQESDFAIQQVAMTKPAIAPGYYYGGHDFNQYAIQFAEENIYPAAKGSSLLAVYNQSIQPLLKEWDVSARLIESRAQINAQDPEYIQLPGSSGEPMKVLPQYVFRFASTPLKQTLNVYVLSNEIRVHRMVWGEAQIDINRVKIDSDQALAIARKAFADRQSKPAYPVYPNAEEQQRPNVEVIYDLPEKLTWQLNLNQQEGKKLRYFLSFYWSQGQRTGGVPLPVPRPEPAAMTSMADTSVSSSGAAPTIAIDPPAPGRPDTQPYMSYSGSLELDAVSGEILSLNRPVYYKSYPGEVSSGGGSTGVGIAYPVSEAATVRAQ